MVVHQWVPAAHRGDAIGDSARQTRDIMRAMGHESDLFALTIDDDMRDEARPFDDETATRADATIYHFALPSRMTEAFVRLRGARILQYHNITPARFFAPYDPALFRLATLGREELASLTDAADLALGDSAYNRGELDALGFRQTDVMPIAVDTARLRSAPRQPSVEKILGDGLMNFLFVGRLAPNKCVDDIIRLAEHYKRYVDAFYRFVFVGRYDGVPRYYATVRALIDRFDMLDERFLFTGPVPDGELAAYYRHAAVYVSLSEHEGFCVPLIEAMAMDVPVLAYSAAAVPDTLGGAGVQFAPKDLEQAAELLGELAYNDELRASVIAGQQRRLAEFSEARIAQRLRDVIARVA